MPAFRRVAILLASGNFHDSELFDGNSVVAFVGEETDELASGTLLCPVHQQFQFLFAGRQSLALVGKLLAAGILVFARIGKQRRRVIKRGTARQQNADEQGA